MRWSLVPFVRAPALAPRQRSTRTLQVVNPLATHEAGGSPPEQASLRRGTEQAVGRKEDARASTAASMASFQSPLQLIAPPD